MPTKEYSAMPTTPIRSAEGLVAELFRVIDESHWNQLAEVLAEDCVFERPGAEPFVGLERIKRFYQDERPVASGSHQVDGILSDTGSVACWGWFRGLSQSGQRMEVRFAETLSVQGGRIVHRTTYLHSP